MSDIPRIISTDDHVVEPPDLWTSRLPSKYADRAPRVERDKAKFSFVGGVFSYNKGAEDGDWCDFWLYDDLIYPFPRLSAAIGFPDLDNTPVTFDEIRPGCWKQADRLADMDANHMDASICFPNVLPRFCGQTFYERADKELALLCVQAYNDWMIDEWCAGAGKGKLIPLTIVPLWDAELAAAEVRRCAAKGSYAVTFSENPYPLGLPSVHDANRFWDPFFTAVEETDTTLCMHIGSSSTNPAASPDAPAGVGGTLAFNNSMASLADWLFSGNLIKFPNLKLAYSEGQIGWIPYALERADTVWEHHDSWQHSKELVPNPPSTYYFGRIFGCFTADHHGLHSLTEVGEDNICFETDYPHTDTTWPTSKEYVEKILAGFGEPVVYKVLRGNAIQMLELDRVSASWGRAN